MILWQVGSPSPVPSERFRVCSRWNIGKMRSRYASPIPIPLPITRTCHVPSSGVAGIPITDGTPGRRNLSPSPISFCSTCAGCRRFPATAGLLAASRADRRPGHGGAHGSRPAPDLAWRGMNMAPVMAPTRGPEAGHLPPCPPLGGRPPHRDSRSASAACGGTALLAPKQAAPGVTVGSGGADPARCCLDPLTWMSGAGADDCPGAGSGCASPSGQGNRSPPLPRPPAALPVGGRSPRPGPSAIPASAPATS